MAATGAHGCPGVNIYDSQPLRNGHHGVLKLTDSISCTCSEWRVMDDSSVVKAQLPDF